MVFTGYLLPWNELAYFATKVGTEITGVLPIVGSFLGRLTRGGDEVTGATLTRFYGIHVAVLPFLTTALLGLHLFLVQKHGMSVPPGVERRQGSKRTMPFLPHFMLRDLVGWLSALAILAALAAYFPTELGQKVDPFEPAPAGIKPEWYFMFMFQTLKYFAEFDSGHGRRSRRYSRLWRRRALSAPHSCPGSPHRARPAELPSSVGSACSCSSTSACSPTSATRSIRCNSHGPGDRRVSTCPWRCCSTFRQMRA